MVQPETNSDDSNLPSESEIPQRRDKRGDCTQSKTDSRSSSPKRTTRNHDSKLLGSHVIEITLVLLERKTEKYISKSNCKCQGNNPPHSLTIRKPLLKRMEQPQHLFPCQDNIPPPLANNSAS